MSSKVPYIIDQWNVITGCQGKGCATRETCWARAMVKRFPALHGMMFQWDGKRAMLPINLPFERVSFHPNRLDQPLHWRKPRRIGVCFLGDWMDDQVKPAWIDQILEVVAACPQHQFFALTKQPQNLELDDRDYPPNLWNGISCCTQADLDRMLPDLLRIPGHKWISVEPLLSPIDRNIGVICSSPISFVVIGCHSHPRLNPCKMEWIESIVGQCQSAGVQAYVKQVQIGNRCSRNPAEWPESVRAREMP